MQIREVDLREDEALARRFHEVYGLARLEGRPWGADMHPTYDELMVVIRNPREGSHWATMVVEVAGEVVAVGGPMIRLADNTDKVWLDVMVHPAHRRRGVGRAFAQAQLDWGRSQGRTTALGATFVPWSEPQHPHVRFYEGLGLRCGSRDVLRRLELPVPPELLDGLAVRARRAAQGYELTTYEGALPVELQPGYCELCSLVEVDSPTGEIDFEAEVYTPADYRSEMARLEAQGRTTITTVAMRRTDGAVAAYTELCVRREPRDGVQQRGTYVRREDRGHRLGTAVKAASLQLVARRFPEHTHVGSFNDSENVSMVAINDAFGFRPLEYLHHAVGEL